MNAAIPILLKVTLVFAIAGLAAAVLTRAAAAVRHLVWLAAILVVLLLPAAAWLAPDWTPIREVALGPASTPRIVVDVVAGTAFPIPSLGSFLFGTWLAGAGFVTLRFVSSHRKAAALAAQSGDFLEDGSVRISGEIAIPIVCGLVRPVVVLPKTARAWPLERLRVVLAHESMHVQRRDLLWQALAQCACVLYWYHPLVWWAASRLGIECEQACDDGVLAQGERASDYAGHLVEIVRGIAAEPRMVEGAIAMARFTQLEQRISALFNSNRSRGPASGRMLAVTSIAAIGVLLPLASLRAPAQTGKAPAAAVEANSQAALANGVTGGVHGGVKGGVPGGVKQGVRGGIAGGVSGARNTAETKRIRVGGNKQQAKLINKVMPVYPPECKAEKVEGSLSFRTVISKTGEPIEIVLETQGADSRLVDSALDALRQWRWEPTLLNGEPVEVITQVDINFTLTK